MTDESSNTSLINMKSWNLTLREVILILIAGLLLLLVLVFAGLYGKTESQLDCWTTTNASVVMDAIYCTSSSCLKTADRFLQLMNKSVDPCENFYEYACGNYQISKPFFVDAVHKNVLDDVKKDNEDRLIAILEKPVSQNDNESYEYKLKQFFRSCNTVELRESNRGTPFLTKVVSALGGWKVLGTWDHNWDFNTALKKVHADFAVDVLYQVSVLSDESNARQNSIAIRSKWTGKYLSWWESLLRPHNEGRQHDYKTFMRRVGSLLIGDATDAPHKGSSLQEQYLEEFINDTWSIQNSIAEKISITNNGFNFKTGDYYSNQNIDKVTLENLATDTSNVINWIEQLSYIFNQTNVDRNTEVVVINRNYIRSVTAMIASLPGEVKNRMLHNYLIWRVAEKYFQYLSWEYIHANREITQDAVGQLDIAPLYRNCFSAIADFMPDALGSLFLTEYFTDDSKQTVTEIIENIKLALKTQIDTSTWFDQETKAYAKEKVDLVKFRIGHPDWMANQTYVNGIYSELTINVSDFFGNVLTINKLKRSLQNKQLLEAGHNRDEWTKLVYDTHINFKWDKDEFVFPAGMLQPPVYFKDQPHYATFGCLGSHVGSFVYSVVDSYGQYINKQGHSIWPSSWWSNSSREAFEPIFKCMTDTYLNMTRKSDNVLDAEDYLTNIRTVFATHYTLGIRLARTAYINWLNVHSLFEKPLPGVEMTSEQMIFLAYAQSLCYDKEMLPVFNPWDPPNDIKVNFAVSQLREFNEAFKCQPQSNMNQQKKCDYI